MSGSSDARDRIGEPDTREPQEHEQTHQVSGRAFQVGETFPAVCGIRDVARALNRSVSRAHQLQKAGRLKVFELADLGDGVTRYSGRLLQQWAEKRLDQSFVNGQLDRPRTFGRRQAS